MQAQEPALSDRLYHVASYRLSALIGLPTMLVQTHGSPTIWNSDMVHGKMPVHSGCPTNGGRRKANRMLPYKYGKKNVRNM